MLGAQALFMHGYRDSQEGRSEMKPLANLIWRDVPNAAVFTTDARMKTRAPVDLSIYLNRTVWWVDDASQILVAGGQPACWSCGSGRTRPSPPRRRGGRCWGRRTATKAGGTRSCGGEADGKAGAAEERG